MFRLTHTPTLAVAWLSMVLCFGASPADAQQAMTGEVGTELTYFPRDAGQSPQDHHTRFAAHAAPELYLDAWDGRLYTLVAPFVRVDERDGRRSHTDLREALVGVRGDDYWELRAGFVRSFWGVTESKHLVNAINQTDLVENPDGEDFLGQPAVQLGLSHPDLGLLDVYGMAGFRERTFPGARGRLRFPAVIDDDARYQSEHRRAQPELALRYSHSFLGIDLGLHYFYGNQRDPILLLDTSAVPMGGAPVFVPYYRVIHQAGLDAQLQLGDFLLKLEALARAGKGFDLGEEARTVAATTGFEYTLVGVFDSAIDLGLLLEYSYDDRDFLAPGFLDDDVFGGMRLAFNDEASTTVLAGAATDVHEGSTFVNLEASRRLGDSLTLELEARAFAYAPVGTPSHALRRDAYVQTTLLTYF